jgi:hypothetical protein
MTGPLHSLDLESRSPGERILDEQRSDPDQVPKGHEFTVFALDIVLNIRQLLGLCSQTNTVSM